MKSQKINDGLWSVTAPNGNYAHLTKCFDGWEVSCWSANGQTLLCHGDIHERRFDAKIEAGKLLAQLENAHDRSDELIEGYRRNG